uniref:Glycerophosphodiester phosphodiesterase domain-containing protein 1-like n=1 Tax=Sinocyclocheilus rhinocerous TaxID=307959 RepID=A0A673KRD8_9TELE
MSAAVYVLSTVTGYVLTSALLLKWPSLLHRRKKEAFRSRHISHRGGDCDVQNAHLVGSSLGFETQSVNESYRVTFITLLTCYCEGGDDKRIPLLRDVFEAFPNTPINIDIKVNNDTLIKKVSELVVRYNKEHLTIWGNSSNEVNPQIPILFSLPRVLLLLGLFYTGLLPFVPLKEQFLEIPMPSIISNHVTLILARVVNILEFRYECIFRLLMRKALFDHLTSRGIQVCVWVLNDEEDFKRAFDLGATGIMTDYPTKLKEFMEKKQLHS